MKGFKKIVSVLAAAALLVAPMVPAVSADAAGPTTFYLRYDTDKHDWRMQIGEWLEDYEGQDIYYINNGSEKAKDGDVVVILNNDNQEAGVKGVTVNAHLSNVTVNRATTVFTANGIDNCYVLGDSYAAINGNVANGYVYDTAKCNFNNNVTNLHLVSSQKNDVDTSVSVLGTVTYCSVENPAGIVAEYSNFKANTFYYDFASGLMTDEANYTKNGAPVAGATATADAVPAAGAAAPAASAANGDYDDVPKTGENNLAIWLFGLSALSFAGCVAFKKSANK